MQDPLKFSFFFHQLLTYMFTCKLLSSQANILHSFETLTVCNNNAKSEGGGGGGGGGGGVPAINYHKIVTNGNN